MNSSLELFREKSNKLSPPHSTIKKMLFSYVANGTTTCISLSNPTLRQIERLYRPLTLSLSDKPSKYFQNTSVCGQFMKQGCLDSVSTSQELHGELASAVIQ